MSVFAFGLAASSFPALLSVFAKEVIGTNARGYGLMLGAIGVGAVLGAFALQRCRTMLHARGVVSGAMAIYGVVVLAVSRTTSLHLAVLLLLPAGVAWISSLSSLNALVQLSAPAHVKSRILGALPAGVFFRRGRSDRGSAGSWRTASASARRTRSRGSGCSGPRR